MVPGTIVSLAAPPLQLGISFATTSKWTSRYQIVWHWMQSRRVLRPLWNEWWPQRCLWTKMGKKGDDPAFKSFSFMNYNVQCVCTKNKHKIILDDHVDYFQIATPWISMLACARLVKEVDHKKGATNNKWAAAWRKCSSDNDNPQTGNCSKKISAALIFQWSCHSVETLQLSWLEPSRLFGAFRLFHHFP